MSKQIELTVDGFNNLPKDSSYMVKFWAEWCGPCKALNPVLEEIAEETGFTIYKMDVDTCMDLSRSLGIRGIPTMMFFKNGALVHTLVANQPKKEIVETINHVLSTPDAV